MRYIPLTIMALAAMSCSRNNTSEISLFHEDGRSKPTVAVASMLDTTTFDASWSLSEELTEGVMKRLAASGQIVVHSQEESPFTENPFATNLSWMKREFQGHEFVAFLELVEHEFVPVLQKGASDKEASANLNMAVRLRVVDLRPNSPKVVLQEMVKDSYFVPKTLIPHDYTVDGYGSDHYTKSPMAAAHDGFMNEIASRITDYILLAKNR